MDALDNDELFSTIEDAPTPRIKRPTAGKDGDKDLKAPPAKRPRLNEGASPSPVAAVQPKAPTAASAASDSMDTTPVDGGNYYSAIADSTKTEFEMEPIRPRAAAPKPHVVDKLDIGEKTATDDELMAERKKCSHQICIPAGYKEPEQVFAAAKRPPAKLYPFTLDPFQKVAVDCLEKAESVLVSAHTSAGKTVVAQYAIAMALRDKQRVIYTSPIKALSNQKYRELFEEFKDVGLMTGDITINPDASCLVMTTEILRSMLYRGSEILREVGWVIFDEIHYMRDKERGVVWEETIILLAKQPGTKFVFLSATIPNASEFANWVAQIHNQPCHVVYTDFRPVPLQHYMFPAGGEGLFLVVDELGKFREDNFQRSLAALQPAGEKTGSFQKRQKKTNNDIYRIVKVIMDRHYEPVIVFAFSKKSCEALAMTMAKLDFLDEEEKKMVDLIFNNAIDNLSEDDKTLPQVQNILPLLKRGVGIHHSGLLPLLKEVIEILFQEGLVRCLFATETFSIGLNMPAKTVVFTSVRKFDGRNFRWVTGGEYIQMSGRAGRRGLDDRGIVIMMVDEKMEPAVAKDMVKGSADMLNSQFYIGYNMLLNLIRMEGMHPEKMLMDSFHQFQNNQSIPKLKEELMTMEGKYRDWALEDEELLAEYFQLNTQLLKFKDSIRSVVNEPVHILPFLKPGRLVRVKDGATEWGWGVVINFQKRVPNPKDKTPITASTPNTSKYVIDVLLGCKPGGVASNPAPCPPGANPEPNVVPVLLSLLDGVSSLCVYLPKDIRALDARQSVFKSLAEVQRRYPNGVPPLDPIEDMQIKDSNFKKVIAKIETLEENLLKNPIHAKKDDAKISANYEQYKAKARLHEEIRALRKKLKKADNIILKEELKSMKRVLRRLGFLTSDSIIDVKGRVAAEINAADELVVTELLFSGFFTELKPAYCAAILSVFVFDEKTEMSKLRLSPELQKMLLVVQDTGRRVAQVSQECKITIDPEEYIAKFKPGLMDVVYNWANGAKFIEIIGLTQTFEGSIIRAMRRLEELLREMMAAAKSMGSSDLENKFAEAITLIKRDIVFAASLYL